MRLDFNFVQKICACLSFLFLLQSAFGSKSNSQITNQKGISSEVVTIFNKVLTEALIAWTLTVSENFRVRKARVCYRDQNIPKHVHR